MKIYQPSASGRSLFLGNPQKIVSRKVFKTEQAAIQYEEEFRKIVSTPLNERDTACLDPSESIDIFIGELELEE